MSPLGRTFSCGNFEEQGPVCLGGVLRASIGVMESNVMYRALWTAHSSFCSTRMAPISRMMAFSLGKIPTTSVRRLISPLRRSSRLIEWSLVRRGIVRRRLGAYQRGNVLTCRALRSHGKSPTNTDSNALVRV